MLLAALEKTHWLALLAVGVCACAAGCPRMSPPAQPARIVSGSMAPYYFGLHWEVTCGDCGHRFRCGVEHPPRGLKAVCPNCGYAENEIDESDVQPGTPVEVVPRDFSAEPPRRWEVVAFQEPATEHLAVKRVAGLPGERVAIREGDIFIDGVRAQKSPAEFADVAQTLYNELSVPRLTKDFPHRWRPAASDSLWENIQPDQPGYGLRCRRAEDDGDEVDWLAYHHLSGAAIGLPRTADSRILDHHPYNQGLSRKLNAVTDVMLLAAVKLRGDGDLWVRLLGGERPMFVRLSPKDRRVALFHGENLLADASLAMPLPEGLPIGLFVGIVDRRAIVEIDDELALACDLETLSPSLFPADVSLAVGSRRLDVDLVMPSIDRDIYYLNPHHRPDDWEMDRPLGEDEYFVLGDNPPNSRDSRHYGPVKRSALSGEVRLAEQ